MRITARFAFSLFLAIFLFTSMGRVARADGLIIVESAERTAGHFPFAPLEVRYHRVSVEIDDDVAVTSVDQEFFNPASRGVEGTYIFPLPENAHIDKFSMDVNGRQVEAELLSADKARQIYEDIVRKSRDPALLEYAGRGAFRARIFPIEAHSTKRVQIKYTQLLRTDSGLAEYMYPLNTEKFSSRPIGEVSVEVRLRSRDPLKTISCPTHDAKVRRVSETEAAVSMSIRNGRPDTDFKLLFSRDRKEMGLRLLTFKREGAAEGYFMLLASPGWQAKQGRDAQGKDIVFVLDTSGSMGSANKLDQAKKALSYCLSNLRPQDNFNIVRFSTEAELFHPTLTSADDPAKIAAAKDWIAAFPPNGGTAIDDALATALKLRPADRDGGPARRPFMVVFLTDGLPTVGVADEDQLVKRALDRAAGLRIFCFGLGSDVNTHLLDRLSDSTRAVSTYVAPNEDLELKLASFYDKVNEPAVTDVQVRFDGEGGGEGGGGVGLVQATQVYPVAMPDLFKGQTIQVFGRYKGSGAMHVKLSGLMGGERREFVEDVTFTDRDTKNGFIPTMWATRRVGWLLDELRQHGESAELKDEIVRLAREHGIVTPYTAYLITEDETRRNVPVSMRGFQEMQQDRVAYERAKDSYDSTQREAQGQGARSGEQAVQNSKSMNGMKYADSAQAAQQVGGMPATAPTEPGYRAQTGLTQAARVVGGRAFYQNGKRWIDAEAQVAQGPVKSKNIRFNSEEYFTFVRDHPEATSWVALGNEVDVMIGDTLYAIRDEAP